MAATCSSWPAGWASLRSVRSSPRSSTDRDAYGRVTLLFGARSPDLVLYRDEIEVWATRLDLDVGVTVDAADASWNGHVGVVTRLVERAELASDRVTAFVCGPEVMMRFAAISVIDRGIDPGRIWLSLERNMHCAIGHCGHCQLGPMFVCKDGPVLSWPTLEPLMAVRER